MITSQQFKMLDDLYSYYNKTLFGGKLKDCMIITSRKKGAKGFFISDNWTNKKKRDKKQGMPYIHEISLNPDWLDREEKEWQSTLVHEMVHLWQQENGKPSRGNYHNKEWARKMEEIGLMPSNTGEEGGKKTGQRMTHYIMPNGPFIKAFNDLTEKSIDYVSSALVKTDKAKAGNKTASKIKYSCHCGNNVWGKPGLNIVCADCQKSFEQEG